MAGSTSNVDLRSHPTLDLHTDAILLREDAGALATSYVRGSSRPEGVMRPSALTPTSAPTPTPTPTPTEPEPPLFPERKSTFRAAATFVVRPSPAMERVRLRSLAAALARSSARPPRRRNRTRSLPWPLFATLALGATITAFADGLHDRSVAIAAFASMVAGVVTLSAAMSRIWASRRRASARLGH